MTPVDVIRHDVAPVLMGYLVFLAVLFAYWFGRRSGKTPRMLARGSGPGSPEAMDGRGYFSVALVRYLAPVFVGGYAFFLLIVVAFYFVIGERSRTFISQALGQGSLFTFAVVLPGFLVLSFLEDRVGRFLRRRKARGPGR